MTRGRATTRYDSPPARRCSSTCPRPRISACRRSCSSTCVSIHGCSCSPSRSSATAQLFRGTTADVVAPNDVDGMADVIERRYLEFVIRATSRGDRPRWTLRPTSPGRDPGGSPFQNPRGMNRGLKRLAEAAIVGSGVARLTRYAHRSRVLVLAYHNIVPNGETADGDWNLHLPQREFALHLDTIGRTHDVVPLASIFDPPTRARPRVAITFDDAYAGALRRRPARARAARHALDDLRRAGAAGSRHMVGRTGDARPSRTSRDRSQSRPRATCRKGRRRRELGQDVGPLSGWTQPASARRTIGGAQTRGVESRRHVGLAHLVPPQPARSLRRTKCAAS